MKMKETSGSQETELCSLHTGNSIAMKFKKCVLLGGWCLFRCLFSVWLFLCSDEIEEGQHCFHYSQTCDQPIVTDQDEKKDSSSTC